MSAILYTIIVVSCLFASVPTWMFWIALIGIVFDFLEFIGNQ